MSEIYDGEILLALQAATLAAVAASIVGPDFPIKFIGRTLEVPNDQRWLEEVFLPNNRTGDFWGDEKNYQGLYRLILHWPNDDAGAATPFQVLASICSPFVKSVALQNVRISVNPDAGGSFEQGKETLYPATLTYRCFRP